MITVLSLEVSAIIWRDQGPTIYDAEAIMYEYPNTTGNIFIVPRDHLSMADLTTALPRNWVVV